MDEHEVERGRMVADQIRKRGVSGIAAVEILSARDITVAKVARHDHFVHDFVAVWHVLHTKGMSDFVQGYSVKIEEVT